MPSSEKYQLIDSAAALADVCQHLAEHPWVAIDTEFMRERTYYPELSLVQIGTPEGCWCIDPLAIDDLSALKALLLNRNVIKVFHSASQDVEILYYLCDDMPGPLFDTQIAASMLGHGDQIGYANLVREVLDVHLEKTQSRTDWSRRPLTDAQLSYAADDVIYLQQMYIKMVDELKAKGRLEWLTPDFEQLGAIENFKLPPDALLKKVKGQQRLSARQLGVAREIAVWRENRSQRADKPRKWVMSDDILCDISKQLPNSIDALSQIRGIHDNLVKHHGEHILSAIAAGKSLPEDQLPRPKKHKKLSPDQQVVVETLSSLLTFLASQADISAQQLASRKDLEKVILGDSEVPLLNGWRKPLAGDKVKRFLAGELSIKIDQGKLVLGA